MVKIFISYYDEDSQDITERIADYLLTVFGSDNVIRDASEPASSVQQCDVVLVIVGTEWLRSMTEHADPPGDPVRAAIETALKLNKPLITAFVNDVVPPDVDQLPPEIRELGYQDVVYIRSGPDFEDDCAGLVYSLEQGGRPRLGSAPPEPPAPAPPAPSAPGRSRSKKPEAEEVDFEEPPVFELDRHESAPRADDEYLKEMDELEGAGPEESANGDDDGAIAAPEADEVAFSSYAPREIGPGRRYSLYVYAHLADALDAVSSDVERFQDELGGTIPRPGQARQRARLREETPVTVVPECDEIAFDPPSMTKQWFAPWTRFGFDFRARDEDVNDTLFVRVSIQVAGVEIAHLKCAVDVVEAAAGEDTPPVDVDAPLNPLAAAKLNSQTTTPYQRIFISYSRKDSGIARSYKIAQTALGNEAFLDVDNLRAGEDWRAALARAIDEADIFQLFWSEHSANSEYCRYEWDYAMSIRCPDDVCEGFIRPVYWRKPMPAPPPELSRINFRFVPFEDDGI